MMIGRQGRTRKNGISSFCNCKILEVIEGRLHITFTIFPLWIHPCRVLVVNLIYHRVPALFRYVYTYASISIFVFVSISTSGGGRCGDSSPVRSSTLMVTGAGVPVILLSPTGNAGAGDCDMEAPGAPLPSRLITYCSHPALARLRCAPVSSFAGLNSDALSVPPGGGVGDSSAVDGTRLYTDLLPIGAGVPDCARSESALIVAAIVAFAPAPPFFCVRWAFLRALSRSLLRCCCRLIFSSSASYSALPVLSFALAVFSLSCCSSRSSSATISTV